MAAAPSPTIVRTAASLQSPAPASSVSAMWTLLGIPGIPQRFRQHRGDSALRPRGVRLVSVPFVSTITEPCFAARRAKESPAMPAPITRKSAVMCRQHGPGFPTEKGNLSFTRLDPPAAASHPSCMSFFITGTDTGVGKTYVTRLILETLRNAGHGRRRLQARRLRRPGGRRDSRRRLGRAGAR